MGYFGFLAQTQNIVECFEKLCPSVLDCFSAQEPLFSERELYDSY